MASSVLIPFNNNKNRILQLPKSSSDRYSIHDYGHGYRTYSYEFYLADYEPEQITVLLDDCGGLRIRAYRSPCQQFRREYDLGGPSVETKLVRNTIDMYGRLRIDVDVRPRRKNTSLINTNNNHTDNVLTFDLQGYRPKNVTVRIDENGLLKVNAQHITDTSGHLVSREYYRQYQLPKSINPNQIRAKLNENHILTIELPQSSLKRKISWEPYDDKNDSQAYGKGSYGDSCYCNIM